MSRLFGKTLDMDSCELQSESGHMDGVHKGKQPSSESLKRQRLGQGVGKRKVEFSDCAIFNGRGGETDAKDAGERPFVRKFYAKSNHCPVPWNRCNGGSDSCAVKSDCSQGAQDVAEVSYSESDDEITPHSVICNYTSAQAVPNPNQTQGSVPAETHINHQIKEIGRKYVQDVQDPCQMSNTQWLQHQQHLYQTINKDGHSHLNSSGAVPCVHGNSGTTTTFGPAQPHGKKVGPSISNWAIQREKQQKQWEAELDLIVPVPESPLVIHHSSAGTGTAVAVARKQAFGQDILHKEIISAHHGQSKSSTESQNSRLILIPESRSCSNLRLSHSMHQLSPSTTTSTTDPEKSSDLGRRRLFCEGFELDLRQICVLCGFLIVAAALGVGVGVPIALRIQSHSRHSTYSADIARRLLAEVPLVDGHNDLAWNLRKFLQNQLVELNFDTDLRQVEPFAGSPWSQTDLKRLREGGIGTQLWSAYVPCSAQHLDAVQIAVEQIDVIKRLVDKHPSWLSLVQSVNDMEKAHKESKIGSLIAVEGGHALGNSLAVLRMLYDLGARSLTMTHNCNTPWADSASSDHYLPDRGGLTEFGKLVVLEANRLGLIVDLAHVSVQTMKDALSVSRAPLIFSHSAAAALCNHSRNVPDDVLRLVTSNGGLVMVSFYNVFIACNETASLQDVIAHIEHVREVAGVDHVGIGAGYDGINFVPAGLEDVSKYPHLIEALLRRSTWTELDLKKLIGMNFLRVFRQVEKVRDDWRRAGVGPIEEWIPKGELEGHPTTCNYRGSGAS